MSDKSLTSSKPDTDLETVQTGMNNTTLISKNVTIHKRRTSIRLEPEMWAAIKEIAKREKCTIHRICSVVFDRKNKKSSLTAAIRVFIMAYYRAAATEEGHAKAGHGYSVRHNLPMREFTDALKKTA